MTRRLWKPDVHPKHRGMRCHRVKLGLHEEARRALKLRRPVLSGAPPALEMC